MGPILFNLYIVPIFNIIDKYNIIKYHSYADDLQLYINSTSYNDTNSIKVLGECIHEFSQWFNNNSLKINPDKTKIVYIDLKYKLKIPQLECYVDINNICYKLSDSEKNLGVMIDKKSYYESIHSKS